MYKSVFSTSMTPVEGSDLDKGVRPLSRGRKGVLHIAIHRSSALHALTCAYLTRIPQLGSFFGGGGDSLSDESDARPDAPARVLLR